MERNSKQNEESFLSLIFQFALMMLVVWVIFILIRPFFPEQTENEPIAENGKRNFQYACQFKTIDEEDETEEFTETINVEEISEVSYDVESYINNLYILMVEKMERNFHMSIEKEHIDVKKYSFSNTTDVDILEDEEKSFLIVSDSVEQVANISEEYQYEIMVKLAEMYQIQYEKQNHNMADTYYEEKEFGEGLKRLVYENMVDISLEKNENLIIYFLKKTFPNIVSFVINGEYSQLDNAFLEAIEEKANIHIFYTPLEGLEYHLKQYYDYEKDEYEFVCCLEMALMPVIWETDEYEKETSFEKIKEHTGAEYWAYLNELLYE